MYTFDDRHLRGSAGFGDSVRTIMGNKKSNAAQNPGMQKYPVSTARSASPVPVASGQSMVPTQQLNEIQTLEKCVLDLHNYIIGIQQHIKELRAEKDRDITLSNMMRKKDEQVSSLLAHAKRQQKTADDAIALALEQKNKAKNAQYARGAGIGVPIDIAHGIGKIAETVATVVNSNKSLPGGDMYSPVLDQNTQNLYPESLYSSQSGSVASMYIDNRGSQPTMSPMTCMSTFATPNSPDYNPQSNLIESLRGNEKYLQGFHNADTLSSRTGSPPPVHNLMYSSNGSSSSVSGPKPDAAFGINSGVNSLPIVLPVNQYSPKKYGSWPTR